MVLQRREPLAVWGRASEGESVEVRIGNQEKSCVASETGDWRVVLDPMEAGGPHEMVVESGSSIRIPDVWIGEVWLGSGQSNMVMTVRHSEGAEQAGALADGAGLRVFTETSPPSAEQTWRGRGEWVRCDSASVGDVSAVLFYFGLVLSAELDVPIGLIDSSMSGTPIQSWISRETQASNPRLAPFHRREQKGWETVDLEAARRVTEAQRAEWEQLRTAALEAGRDTPKEPVDKVEYLLRHGGPGGLFRGKIAPLQGYGLAGILWYQGEDNVVQGPLYGDFLETLIGDWRARWGRPELPFGIVQIAPFGDGRMRAEYAEVRDAQRRALQLPRTGLAVTLDVGDLRDVHPRRKRPVGERLAGWALHEVYGRDTNPSSPQFHSVTRISAGLEVRVGSVRTKLVWSSRHRDGFEVGDVDGKWHPAQAELRGDRILISCPELAQPAYARYGWSNRAQARVKDQGGLPLGPFTTAPLTRWSPEDVLIRRLHWIVVKRL